MAAPYDDDTPPDAGRVTATSFGACPRAGTSGRKANELDDELSNNMKSAVYYLGLSCLFTHELDAVTHSQWRLLVGLRSIPDATALPVFVSLHVPLFFFILWLSHHRRESVRDRSRLFFATFLVVHAVLHFINSSAPEYDFHGLLSNLLIGTAASCGAVYLALHSRT